MKHSLKIISGLLVMLLTLTSIIALIYFGECTVRDYKYLSDSSAGGDFGGLGYILSWPLIVLFLVIRIIAGIIIIIEIALLIEQYIITVKNGSYDRYWKYSLVGFIETFINGVIFVTLVVGPGDVDEERFLKEVSLATIIYVLVFVLSIINIHISRKGEKKTENGS